MTTAIELAAAIGEYKGLTEAKLDEKDKRLEQLEQAARDVVESYSKASGAIGIVLPRTIDTLSALLQEKE